MVNAPSKNVELALAREKIMQCLDNASLPAAGSQKIYGGYGKGQLCAACDQPVRETDVLYEVEVQPELETETDTTILNMHRWCFDIWMEESLVRCRQGS